MFTSRIKKLSNRGAFCIACKIFFFVIGITNGIAFGLPKSEKSNQDVFSNIIYDSTIHTVLFRNADWELSMPFIELGTGQALELSFDDLSGQQRNFGYTLIHCDAGWKRSDLSPNEYLEGRQSGVIHESEPSFNTTFGFMHYILVFPNEDCKPFISGNYVILIYDEGEPERILLSRRFYVYEKMVGIEASVRQPVGKARETGQQVLFSVTFDRSVIYDPVKELSTVVMQNNRPDRMIIHQKPYSFSSGRMDFTGPEDGIFGGGNEFRSLDIKSMKYQTANIQAIEFPDPYYHVLMKPDESRSNKPYFSNTDQNGGFYIDREKSDNRHTEADYVYVKFRLKLPYFYTSDQVYVAGQFNDWSVNRNSAMHFNEVSGNFECTVLLKQGLYDYCFMKYDEETGNVDEFGTEGCFYETENDYTILVYYHDQHQRYDHLAGYLSIK